MTDDEQIELIAASVRNVAQHLHYFNGIPAPLILAVMHAEVIAMIATTYGGAQAAQSARNAAEKVEGLPSYADCPLAAMQPVGRA